MDKIKSTYFFILGIILLLSGSMSAQQYPFVFLGRQVGMDDANTIHAGHGHYSVGDLGIWMLLDNDQCVNLHSRDTVPWSSVEAMSFHKYNRDSLSYADQAIVNEFEKKFKGFLTHMDSTTFPKQEELQRWTYYYWNFLLEEDYKQLSKDNELRILADIHIEPLIQNTEWRKRFINIKKIYQERWSLRHSEYDVAAHHFIDRLHNGLIKPTPQEFTRALYLPVLCNAEEKWRPAGRELESVIIQWYEDNKTAFSSRVTEYPTDINIMLADYYIRFGTNDTLRAITTGIRDAFVENKGNLKYKKADPKWYEYLCNIFSFTGLLPETDYNQMLDSIASAGFNTSIEHIAEYACQYCLYQMIRNTSYDYDNVSRILNRVQNDINYAESDVFNYAEKYIISDLLAHRIEAERSSVTYIPPTLFFRATQTSVKSNLLKLDFILTPGTDTIKDLSVTLGNTAIRRSRALVNKMTLNKELTLLEGENMLKVRYRYSDKTFDSTLTFVYQPDDYTKRRNLALLFAVNDYTDKHIKNLGGRPLVEAVQMAELLYQFGFDTLIFRNPTRRDIIQSLETHSWKADSSCYDQLLVFFSCHGIVNPRNSRGYVLPADAESGKFEETMLSYSYLYDQLNKSPYKHVLLISDACFSGAFLAEGTKGVGDTIDRSIEEPMRHTGRYFIGSATISEEAPERSELVETLENLFQEKLDVGETVTIYDISSSLHRGQTRQKVSGQWGDRDKGYNSTFIFEPRRSR
jgi:hypothetical protein